MDVPSPTDFPPLAADDDETEVSPDTPFFRECEEIAARLGLREGQAFERPTLTLSARWGYVFRARVAPDSIPELGMYQVLVCWKFGDDTIVEARWSPSPPVPTD